MLSNIGSYKQHAAIGIWFATCPRSGIHSMPEYIIAVLMQGLPLASSCSTCSSRSNGCYMVFHCITGILKVIIQKMPWVPPPAEWHFSQNEFNLAPASLPAFHKIHPSWTHVAPVCGVIADARVIPRIRMLSLHFQKSSCTPEHWNQLVPIRMVQF